MWTSKAGIELSRALLVSQARAEKPNAPLAIPFEYEPSFLSTLTFSLGIL